MEMGVHPMQMLTLSSQLHPEETHGANHRANSLVVGGSTMKSMPRMRKSWLRTCDTPKELLGGHVLAAHIPGADGWGGSLSGTDVARPASPPSNVGSLQASLLGVQINEGMVVSPGTMKELEETFLRGVGQAGGRGEDDLSFLNEVDSQLTDARGASSRKAHGDSIPSLNLSKTHTTEPKTLKKMAHSKHDPGNEHRHPQTSKEDLQPYLGAQLKRNLGKLGLEKQHVSLKPDEWDDAESVNMLETNFASKEEERRAKHQQWYSKNLSSTFVKKVQRLQAHKPEKVDPTAMHRLASQGRVSLVVANQDDWRASKTQSLLSKKTALLLSSDSDEIKISELMRAREYKVPTRNGVPVPEARSRQQTRSGSCPPLLAPDARDRLRQSTRFLHSRGQICKRSAAKAFANDLMPRFAASRGGGSTSEGTGGEASWESLDASVHSHNYISAQTQTQACSQLSQQHQTFSDVRSSDPSNRSPAASRMSSRAQTADRTTRDLISQHTVYPGLADSRKGRGGNFSGHGGHREETHVCKRSEGKRYTEKGSGRGNASTSPWQRMSGAEVSSWNEYSPGCADLTPLDCLIQEKEGSFIRSPTKDYDISEADLLREMKAKNIILSPVVRINKEKSGAGDIHCFLGSRYLGEDSQQKRMLKMLVGDNGPETPLEEAYGKEFTLQQSSVLETVTTRVRLPVESIVKQALDEHPAFSDSHSLAFVEDDAIGNCF